ncbi:ribokinase [Devosia sp. YIM 151766]|uniref:ribokinase n=1 Tax=Devosia sp. YIM 151766 TaxID=3017325 RepID=UPI00255C4D15|nr:ribokinase [Devosia sp. YIM 151766]WIY53280.1 ribokinase [Devosia sp. YIM 151766]
MGTEAIFRKEQAMNTGEVVILGAFVADLAFKAPRLPIIGETLLGQGFSSGPGGKGSNQAIAAARAGAKTAMITRIGRDTFGTLALDTWSADGIDTSHVAIDESAATGAAFIFVATGTGDNAIIVEIGAAARLTPADISAAEARIAGASVFLTQFEQPLDAALAGLRVARAHGVTTVLNTAPAIPVDDDIYGLCDYVTPNETEAATLTGIDTSTDEGVVQAARCLLAKGARNALITLGARGALLHGETGTHMVPAFRVENIIDTAGAGDAFNGGFVTALAEGRAPLQAVHFAMAVAGLAVQKPGTGPAMPSRAEIEDLLRTTKEHRHHASKSVTD